MWCDVCVCVMCVCGTGEVEFKGGRADLTHILSLNITSPTTVCVCGAVVKYTYMCIYLWAG